MGSLTTLYLSFVELTKANPVLGGLVGLFGMSVVSFFLVKCPRHIWSFLKNQLTTTVSFTNEERGYSNDNFIAFMEWFKQNHFSPLIRNYALDSSYGRDMTLAVGMGTHLFFWKRRPCWITRSRLDKQGSYVIFYTVTITILGRSRKPIMDMISTFQYRPRTNELGVYQIDNSDWTKVASVEKRSLETVVVNPSIIQALTESIEHFQANRAWYINNGFPYKLTFLLHGVSGTGKTSLIKAIASHYGYNLCLLNLASMSDEFLQKMLAKAPPRSIIAIEDFDSARSTHRRKIVPVEPSLPRPLRPGETSTDELKLSPKRQAIEQEGSPLEFLTLSGILNALQGLLPLEDKILFLTTNHIELMDEALIRKGRVDKILEVGPMRDAEIRRYARMLYPELDDRLDYDHHPFMAQPGCDVQALYYDHRDDPEGFIKALPRALTLVEDVTTATLP